MHDEGGASPVETVSLPDGTLVRLRPVHPGDEALLQQLADHMSREDLRRRFFAPLRELGPALAHRLASPDPDRELALAVLPLAGEEILGVGRLAADAAGHAEYALAVRSERHGQGIGYLLMTRLIAAARARGLGALWGDVLRDNEAMLKMCRELGFRIDAHPADPALLRVTRRL